MNFKDFEYSINDYEHKMVDNKNVLHFIDSDKEIMLDENEQFVWNILVASSKGECNISDVALASCLCKKNKRPIDDTMQTVTAVNDIIIKFINDNMLNIN